MSDLSSQKPDLKPSENQIVQPPILGKQWPDRSEAEIQKMVDEHSQMMGH